MIQLLNLLLLVATVSCYYIENGTSAIKDKIIRGRETDILGIPYIAQLTKNNKPHCGASILSKYWLLTAAHCIKNIDSLKIVTGATKTYYDGVCHQINDTIVHENYDPKTFDNDIALVKLKIPLILSRRRKPIRISKKTPKTGDKLRISGYGVVRERGSISPTLKTTVIPVIDYKVCKDQYCGEMMTDNMFCAGVGGTDSCQGDSGGPAVVNNKLVGIVSNGEGCARYTHAGIYTKVVSYLGWIKKHTNLKYLS